MSPDRLDYVLLLRLEGNQIHRKGQYSHRIHIQYYRLYIGLHSFNAVVSNVILIHDEGSPFKIVWKLPQLKWKQFSSSGQHLSLFIHLVCNGDVNADRLQTGCFVLSTVADGMAIAILCHYSKALTLCNQHLLHNGNLTQITWWPFFDDGMMLCCCVQGFRLYRRWEFDKLLISN